MSLALIAAMTVVSFDTDVITMRVHGGKAKHFAEMGIALATTSAMEPGDPLLQMEFDEGNSGFVTEIRSEGARFNINALIIREDRDLMLGIFTRFGMELDNAEALYDALADWVDPDDDERLNGAESRYYERLGLVGMPFNRPFYDLDELRLVRGFQEVELLRPDWRQWFTIWSEGQLDINEAEAELIAAAVRGDVDTAQGLVDRIIGPDFIRYTEDDVPIQDINAAFDLLGVPLLDREIALPRVTTQSATERIESVGWYGNSRWKISLIVRNRTGRPIILERNEELLP